MTLLSMETRPAEYSLIDLALPGRRPVSFGVLLYDPASDELYHRFREDLEDLADPEDAEVLLLLSGDLTARTRELGGRQVLEWLEDHLSNVLRIADRRPTAVRDFHFALERLYRDRVLGLDREPARVLPFVTHLPVYSLRAAAGKFGEDMDAEAEDWVAAPEGMRLAPDMFVVHVAGRSMEPEIPDGSLAVFRYQPVGSRQGKRVLVWRRGASQAGGEFTVKVYESEKRITEEGWEHTQIRLKPLNPEFEALELDDATEYRILGELVCVLAYEDV
ncbi:MAG: S24 family peptidase [Bryobacteraceae bacterium]|jgi:SOS-response transcriptional repressor LexA